MDKIVDFTIIDIENNRSQINIKFTLSSDRIKIFPKDNIEEQNKWIDEMYKLYGEKS